MKFSSKLSGWPTYILVNNQVKAVGPIARAPNFSNAEAYLRILYKDPNNNEPYNPPILDSISYERDGSVFEIELTNAHKVDDQYYFDCTAKIDKYYLDIKTDGLTLSPVKSKITIMTECGDKIADGGLFKIFKESNYIMITKNSKQIPVLGRTDNLAMASPFVFSWTGFAALKTLIVIFLKARYFIDHPKLINNKELLDDIKQVYSDIGQMIIKNVVGSRKESAYYRDERGHYMNKQNQTMTIQEKFDAGLTFGNGNESTFHRNFTNSYPPFAIPPSTLVDRFANQGVDYQRAVTEESSDAIMNQIPHDTAVDVGIIKNAQKLLLSASIQPAAWDEIHKAVSPIGGSNNVWPCVLIISGNNIGVNFDHPVIRGSLLGSDPLYFKGPYDGHSRERNSVGICIAELPDIATSIADIPITADITADDAIISDLKEGMCPCARGPSKNFTFLHFFILIILITMLVISVQDVGKNPRSEAIPLVEAIVE